MASRGEGRVYEDDDGGDDGDGYDNDVNDDSFLFNADDDGFDGYDGYDDYDDDDDDDDEGIGGGRVREAFDQYKNHTCLCAPLYAYVYACVCVRVCVCTNMQIMRTQTGL